MAVKSFDISGQNQFENYGRWKLLSSLVRLVFVPHLHFDVFITSNCHDGGDGDGDDDGDDAADDFITIKLIRVSL